MLPVSFNVLQYKEEESLKKKKEKKKKMKFLCISMSKNDEIL